LRKLLVVALAVGSVVWVGSLISPQSSLASGVRIVEPRDDQLIGAGKAFVPVEIEAPGRAGAISARLELVGRPGAIAVHLHRSSRTLLQGRIPRASLRVGRDHLFIYSKRGGEVPLAAAHFTVGRERDGLLGLHGVGSWASGPLELRGRVHRGVVLRADLNGRPVTGEFSREGTRLHATLAADDGLRFGGNRLTVTAFDRQSGEYRSIVRRFSIGRDLPLVGAGPRRVVSAGSPIRLDSRWTRAGRGRLALHWRIASAPAGSKPRVLGARSRRPTLVGAGPGEYRLALRATQTTPRPPGAAIASTAVPAATDSTEVCVQPDVLPEGVPIETLGSRSAPAVKVGSATYPMSNPAQSFAQVVILDRCSLALVSNQSYGTRPGGIEAMDSAILASTDQDLVIVSGGGAEGLLGAGIEVLPQIRYALASIGVEPEPGNGSLQALFAAEFSAIGIPGLPGGEAAQLFGANLSAGMSAGSIAGFLRLDSSGNFSFAWPPERVPFELGAASTATRNTITIGGQSYTEELGEAGFHMVWVDRTTLALLGQESLGANEKGMSILAARLEAAQETEALVFISSYGAPDLARSENPGLGGTASAAAQMMQRFGANRYAMLGLAGHGGYSFVGRSYGSELGGPNSGVELVQAEAASATDRITGELTRSDQGTWSPTSNGSPESSAAEPLGRSILAAVLAQPKQPFKPLSIPAQEYIFEKLFATKGEREMDPTFGIRRFYWAGGSDYDAAGFERLATKLAELKPCSSAACAAGYGETKAALIEEFGEVAEVKSFFEEDGGQGSIGHIFARAAGNQGSVFLGVQQYIDGLYGNPVGEPEGVDAGEIYDGVLGVASGAAGLVPGGGVVASALNLVQGASEIAQGISRQPGGASIYNPDTVKVDALEWAEHINAITEAGFAGLRKESDLFVSDEGRLQKIAELLRTKASNGGLAIEEPEETAMRVAIERGEQRYMWETMLPLAVKVALPFSGPFNSPLPAAGPAAKLGVYEVNVPVGKLPQASVRYGWDIAPYVITEGFKLPSAETAKLLFGEIESGQTVATGPLGFRPKYFLTPAAGLANGSMSAGFASAAACRQESIDDYEVEKEEEVRDPKGFTYVTTYVPCAEAEPPYTGRYVLSAGAG
jgi:hypothetical protein